MGNASEVNIPRRALDGALDTRLADPVLRLSASHGPDSFRTILTRIKAVCL
jgi:hypothetical protein